MYEHAESELKKIIDLAESCPEQYRAKAFEILLQGYVATLTSPPAALSTKGPGREASRQTATEWARAVPPDVQPRLLAMAKRRGIPADRLAALFDFTTEPFTYAPINVAGESKKDRTRKVALLVAARSFLSTSRWVADWAEIKAMSTHQNCYDLPNFARALNEGKGGVFKSVDSGVAVELSASGTEAAEKLLAELAQADATE